MNLFFAAMLVLNMVLCVVVLYLSLGNSKTIKGDADDVKRLDKRISSMANHLNEVVEATNANTISMQKAFEGNSTEIQDIIKRMEAAEEGIRQADKKATEISKYYCNYVSREGYNK